MFVWFGNEMDWLIPRYFVPHNNHMHMINSLFTILTSRERLRYFRGNMIILDKN